VSCVKIMLVNHKIVIGFYDGLRLLTQDMNYQRNMLVCFVFMFATCVLSESACIHTMTNDIQLPENYIYHYFCTIDISSSQRLKMTMTIKI
jgi:hypothetical protein